MGKPELTITLLNGEGFWTAESQHDEPKLYGITDGKAVGTYLEHKFQAYLHTNYEYRGFHRPKGLIFQIYLLI